MNIKAIETVYKGYRFRSRLEARWAVFFDALGIVWKYEHEGYDLGKLGWYLPDFEIKLANGEEWFVEVKGDKEDSKGISKSCLLDNHSISLGKWGCRLFGELELLKTDSANPSCYAKAMASLLGVSVNKYNAAIKTARQARFEHGETP